MTATHTYEARPRDRPGDPLAHPERDGLVGVAVDDKHATHEAHAVLVRIHVDTATGREATQHGGGRAV